MFEMTKLVSAISSRFSPRGSAAPYRDALSGSEAPPRRSFGVADARRWTGCLFAARGCLDNPRRLCVPKGALAVFA